MSDWWHADPVVGKADGGDWWKGDPVAEQPSTAQDVLKSGGIGLAKGTIGLAGLPGDARQIMEGLGSWVGDKLGLPPLSPEARAKLHAGPELPTSADIQGQVEKATGKFYEPQTTAGKYAQTVGEFVPGGMAGPGGLVRKAAGTLGAGVGSEFLGEKTEGLPAEPYARLAGAVVGGGLPAAAARVRTPLPFRGTPASAAEHANAVATLEREGVPITAGQRSDRARLKYLENDLSPELNSAQAEAFTSAALRRVGVNATHATTGPHGTVTQALDRIGSDFDRLSGRNALQIDGPLINDLINTHDTYTRTPGLFNQETVGAVTGVNNRILNALHSRGGMLTGEEYQTLRSDLSRAARGATDPQRAEAIHEVLGHIDDAMERSISRTNPADLGAWGQARRDYRNILVLERAATAAGQGVARGYISPAQLASAAKAVYGRRSYMRGVDDFSELAQAGNAVMKPLPDSGTSQRMKVDTAIKALSHVIGGGGGMAAGAHSGIGEGAIGGLLLGEAAAPLVIEPALRGAARGAVMNPVVQHLLGNQAGAPAVRALSTPYSERLARALIQNAPGLAGKRFEALPAQ